MQILGGEMVVRLQECAQDGVALTGVLQSNSLQVTVENLLGLAD